MVHVLVGSNPLTTSCEYFVCDGTQMDVLDFFDQITFPWKSKSIKHGHIDGILLICIWFYHVSKTLLHFCFFTSLWTSSDFSFLLYATSSRFCFYLSFSFYVVPVFTTQLTYTFTHAHIWVNTNAHMCTIGAHKEEWRLGENQTQVPLWSKRPILSSKVSGP